MISHAAQQLKNKFSINPVVQNGYIHYKITNNETNQTVHCEAGEISETIEEMLDEEK